MIYHYTYRITVNNPTDNRVYYIGVRSCKKHPTQDNYFGSCREFTAWQKENGTVNLTKEILAIWGDRKLAVEHEMKLHEHFEVALNPQFWNKAKQKTTGFDTTGIPSPMRGKTHSEEANKKNRQAHLGKPSANKGIKLSAERIEALRKINLGRPSANKGKKVSEEVKNKTKPTWFKAGSTPWNRGIPALPNVIEAARLANLGKKHTDYTKELKRIKMTGYVYNIVTCPHCNTTGGETSMKRWHFDNCTGAKLYRSRVTVNGVRIHLGYFATKELADIAKQGINIWQAQLTHH